jgi:hypothetical protein
MAVIKVFWIAGGHPTDSSDGSLWMTVSCSQGRINLKVGWWGFLGRNPLQPVGQAHEADPGVGRRRGFLWLKFYLRE